MNKLGRLLKWLILVPVLAVVALLSVANDHLVTLHLNPLAPADPAQQIHLALYQIGFAAFVAGALAGAFIVWNSQRKYRRKARDNRHEAARWQAKAEQAERTDGKTGPLLAGPGLAGPGLAGPGLAGPGRAS
jgi:uncharacterized integral membrane protein